MDATDVSLSQVTTGSAVTQKLRVRSPLDQIHGNYTLRYALSCSLTVQSSLLKHPQPAVFTSQLAHLQLVINQ